MTRSQLLSPFVTKREVQLALVVAVWAAATYQGVVNIGEQRAIHGTFIYFLHIKNSKMQLGKINISIDWCACMR